MSLDIGRGCMGPVWGSLSRSNQKQWRHLEREKKEMKDFTIEYVSEEKISHLVPNQTHAMGGTPHRR
jgi:hypothetical protein